MTDSKSESAEIAEHYESELVTSASCPKCGLSFSEGATMISNNLYKCMVCQSVYAIDKGEDNG